MMTPEKYQQLMAFVAEQGKRVVYAEGMSRAAHKELDAALALGDPKVVEDARVKSLAAFEAFLDAKIAGGRRITEKARELGT